MKKLLLLYLLLLILSSCSNENQSENLDLPVYSNLIDENSRNEVFIDLAKGDINITKLNTFFQWIDDFNKIEAYQLKEGFQPLKENKILYIPSTSAIEKRWKNKQGNFYDILCRTAAFYLMDDFIIISNTELLKETYRYTESILSNDKDVFETNPNIRWSNETKVKYCILFNPIKIKNDFDKEQKANKIIEYWDKYSITFIGDSISLITVWNDVIIDDLNYIFSGHAGILVNKKSSLLFVEKVNPLYPYQATRFADREQLKKYLMDRANDSDHVIIMENNTWLK